MACERKARIRVLHVDDDPAILEITKIFLRRESNGSGEKFEIVSVLSAEEALMLLRRERERAYLKVATSSRNSANWHTS